IPLEELAGVACFSPYHFHRIFVAVTGESVNGDTNRIRLEKVARVLRFSKKSIATIAYECGFSSPATLSRSFKHYFGVSPSIYRKHKKVKNSKIRKVLFPVDQYHCDMTDEELKEQFPVEIKEFPQRRIAYIRVTDSFRDGVVIKAFDDLVTWAKQRGVYDAGDIFGMSKDDPTITPKDTYCYEVCITIPEKFELDTDHSMESMILPKCQYAVTSVSGDFNVVATGIHYLFNHWLINSPYEPEHRPGLEIFKDKEHVCNWDHFDLDLCIPIKDIDTD
ncbi:MAG: GyrI-like domain-containing protein, partial [Flavobacteriaceae bacterium]